MTLSVPNDRYDIIKTHDEIKWSEIASRAMWKYARKLKQLDKILEISGEKMSATVQAGVLVDTLKKASEGKGLFYTSHPTEKTAFMGGTIATNASGSRSFKYGPTRRHVRRLKMVLPTGKAADLKRGERNLSRADSIIELADGLKVNRIDRRELFRDSLLLVALESQRF